MIVFRFSLLVCWCIREPTKRGEKNLLCVVCVDSILPMGSSESRGILTEPPVKVISWFSPDRSYFPFVLDYPKLKEEPTNPFLYIP